MTTIKIAPSILSADFTRLGEQIQDAAAGGADLIHIDVMDGRFVPNITMGPLVVRAARRATDLPLDVHLMIVEPSKHIDAFASAGADAITVHIEADPNLYRTLTRIRELGCRAGVAVNPHTPADFLSMVMGAVDLINVMTVNPGFGGQSFMADQMQKVTTLRQMIDAQSHDIDLEVDGGINMDTIHTAVTAGANVLIAGTAVFGAGSSAAEAVRMLRPRAVK